jgi:hypothetical protein
VVVVVVELVVLVVDPVVVELVVLVLVLCPWPGGGFAAPPVIGNAATAPSENTTSRAKTLAMRYMAATSSRWFLPRDRPLEREPQPATPHSRDVPIPRNGHEPRYRSALHRPGVDRLL